MYTSNDIVWVKNVTRKQGSGWAYDDKECGQNFLLNWPTKWPGTAATPKVGDVIFLFQKPKYIVENRNYDVHLTHLVTPVSEDVIPDNTNPEHKWCRLVMAIAIADPIASIPNPGYFNFFKPNRGQTHPISNLETRIGLSVNEIKDNIWDLFGTHFCSKVVHEHTYPPVFPENYGEIEGDKIIKKHFLQELTRRNSTIVRAAKLLALRRGKGTIICECCDFDFVSNYGILGQSFIEAHHKIHLSQGERLTNPDHLAMVCSNCHRMLHRKDSNGQYQTIESLKKLIRNTRKQRK